LAEPTNFIAAYKSLNEGTEIPDMFALWCAVAGVSAALGRNSYVKMGPFTIYPNMFIVLVGSSGKVRKSSAINQIEDIIRMLDPAPNIIAQKLSPEALIQSVRQIETKDMTKLMAEKCEGFIIADELATFLNKKSYEAGLASLLIPLYDCKEKFEYRTIGRGSEPINRACLGMLAGSTIEWIRSGIPEEAVGGGLTSRMIFVYVDKPAPPVPFPEMTEEQLKTRTWLVQKLQEITTAKGQFHFSSDALDLYKQEYSHFRETSGTKFFNDKTLEGYASRRANHLIKLAMCLSASDSNDLIIHHRHMQAAKSFMDLNERHLQLVLNMITSNERGAEITYVATIIQRHKQISRHELIRLVSHRMNGRELTEILETLVDSRLIQSCATPNGMGYQITSKPT
jgi:hypothetical protein